VRVVDVSASGCLIESRRPLRVGTVGRLELKLGRTEYVDDIEVVRCEAVESAPPVYHIGVRLLWTSPRHPRSIRHAVARHVAELEMSDRTRVM
jgi:PilZ domain